MERFIHVLTVVFVVALLCGLCILPACTGTNSNKAAELITTDAAKNLLSEAIDAALLPTVEVYLTKHPERAPIVAEVAAAAATEWPQGKTVTLTEIGNVFEQRLAEKTDLSDVARESIMGTLTTLRTVVRSFLNLRGYELPEIVTTDGAALMTQIAAIANSVAAE